MNYLVKVFLIAILIVAINEIAKINVIMGAFIKALPLISIISFIWLYYSYNQNTEVIAKFSADTFWLVLPTLVLFPTFSYLLNKTNLGFWISLISSIIIMTMCYVIFIKALKTIGINL
jgi:hypothetical protein